MTLYDIIYDWFSTIWADSSGTLDSMSFSIGGFDMDMTMWLSHTSTIIVLVVLVLCCALFVRWIFKVVSGAILLK